MKERKVTQSIRVYPDRYEAMYLVETKGYPEGKFFLASAYDTGLDYDAIFCSVGGSLEVKCRLPFTEFIDAEMELKDA